MLESLNANTGQTAGCLTIASGQALLPIPKKASRVMAFVTPARQGGHRAAAT